jgi:5-methyltetrahydrofolate--homocysteine methyltransferase
VTQPEFVVIGENVHATRVLRLAGRLVGTDGQREWVAFEDAAGEPRRLPIPDWYRETQPYREGRVKHISIAVQAGLEGGPDAEVALAYLQSHVVRQVDAGAAYLDLNVDELSPRLSDQLVAMRWLVEHVQDWTDTPIAVDSSHPEIIAAGLRAARAGSCPMLNSASLERRTAVDLAVEIGGPLVVTAAGASGMPADAEGRVTNASAMVDAARAAGIPDTAIYIDPLIFPASVDSEFGRHALDAMRALRARFGPKIHITGGMSNISFGIPGRGLLNDVFLRLAIEAGADSGIVDPLAVVIPRIMTLDLAEGAYALARDALLGVDDGCRTFLRAYRSGALAAFGAAPPARKAS